jgi:hypothetical protein
MRPIVLGALCTMVGSLWAVSPVFAKCEVLYAEAQALVRQAEVDGRDPVLLERAQQCVEEGIKRHSQNRHGESMATLRRCMKMLAE